MIYICIFIFDFNNLAEKLDIKKVENIILKFYQIIKDSPDKTNLSLIIQNCLIEDKEYQPIFNEIIHFNKFEISDELYSFSPNINTLFSNVRAYELTLKKFKFNSKSQLLDFSNFIISSSCKKLTLDDFFIELIIKKDEKDEEYNDLDIYFSFIDNFITINNQITDINSFALTFENKVFILGEKEYNSSLISNLLKFIIPCSLNKGSHLVSSNRQF